MTTQFANSWVKFAVDNIKRWGKTATITRLTANLYDTSILEDGKGSPDIFEDILVCPMDYNSKTYAALKEEPSNNTLTGMRQLYIISTDSYTPNIGDIVSLDNDWRIMSLMAEFEVNSTQCAYLAHIGS